MRTASSNLTSIVEVGNTFALKDVNNRFILTEIDSIGRNNKQDVYIVKKKKKYGMYSLYGNEIIPVQYDKINSFFNQYWIVESNNKKGIFNIQSKKKLPVLYDEIIFSQKVGSEFIVKKENKFGLFDDQFKEVAPIIYDKITNVGIIEMNINDEKKYYLDGKIINKKILVDKTFQIYGDYLSDTKTFYIFEEQNKLGIIDDSGSIILEPKYIDILPRRVINKNVSQNVFFVNSNDKWGMIDITNKLIVPTVYESIDFANTDYLIVGINGLKQLYDIKNNKILDNISFEKYIPLGKYSRIEKEGLETLIESSTMKLLFPYKYESIMHLDNSNYFSVKFNNKYGIIDSNNKIIIPIIYDGLTIFTCGNKAVVEKDGKYGIIDSKNKILLPFTDRYIIAYSNSFERRKENSFEMEIFDCDLKKIESK